ncbi:MAG: HD-GYP domain-containing protein [Desulfohalobiaceae bacterium]
MFEQRLEEKRIKVDQLQVGVYVHLKEHWHRHPFLRSSFLLKQEKQIQALKDVGIDEVWYVPQKSQRLPLPQKEKHTSRHGQEKEQSSSAQEADAKWLRKQQRMSQLKDIQGRIDRCSSHYASAVERLPGLLNDVFAGRKEGLQAADCLVQEMVEVFLSDTEAVLHLMSAEEADLDLTYHFLNVTVLALLIGEAAGLGAEEMGHLGQGALLHDLGKLKIEKKHWRKPREKMNKHELELVKQHPAYASDVLARTDQTQPREVLEVILQHHECLSGIGYPQGLKANRISKLAKIVSVANIYDNLCNPHDPDQAMSPHQALSFMYKHYDLIVDMYLFSLLVKRLGVYPPGCIVELSSREVGKVMAVNGGKPLKPLLMLYDSEVPKKQAAIFDLSEEPDLYIKKCLDPENLSREVYRYLEPKKKIAYYMEDMSKNK